MFFKTCFVARLADGPSPKAFIACRLDPAEWASPAPENLLSFCFPLGQENVRPREYMRPEEFSFTLTGGDGSRLHGFCRRTLPPRGKQPPPKPGGLEAAKQSAMLRYPQVLCIVSPHPWFPFFYKVLELVEKMLRQEDVGAGAASQRWPPSSPAAMFLTDLLAQMPAQPQLGQVLRVRLPATEQPLDFSPPRRALTRGPGVSPLLHADSGSVELEVPPDLGLGPGNAGIATACLLYHLPPRVALTLIAALLMERRIILVASAEDKVSAAVHAAAALIYPFRWQHIYLPLLPIALKDYLAAPMPYLVGLNSDCLPMLRTMAMEEVLLVDLDLGECTPPPDSSTDDAFLLPYAPKLLSALETCKGGTLSSTEFNSTPFIASVMQEYFLKLVGRYRLYIQPENGNGDGGSSKAAAKPGVNGTKDGKEVDDVLRAHGYAFDQAAFVANHKNAAVREFLQHFRHSQMFEVFMTERLGMVARGELDRDSFEAKVTQLMSKQALFGGISGAGLPGGQPAGGGRFSSFMRKTANAMRQSSDSLMKGLKTLGSNQEEAYVTMSRRTSNNSFSSFSLQRVSPMHGVGAGQSPSPRLGPAPRTSPALAGLASRTNSFTQLGRASPGHQRVVSLEDVKPDTFFGDVEDDTGSEAPAGPYPQSGNPSPGPLEQGAARNRSFTALFRLSGSSQPGSQTNSPRHGGLLGAALVRNTSGKSSSSPSLVSLDVQAGTAGGARDGPVSPGTAHARSASNPGPPPPLIDFSLGEPSFSLQAGAGWPAAAGGASPAAAGPRPGSAAAAAEALAAAALSSLPPAPPVRTHASLGSGGGSAGSDAFGSAFGSPMGPPVSRRSSPLQPLSHLAPHSPLSPAAPGSLPGSPAGPPVSPSVQPRQSTASSSNEWTAFAAATSNSSASQHQPMAGEPRAALRSSGGSLGSGSGGARGGSSSGVAAPAPLTATAATAVRQDAFGGLLADTFTAVSEELVRRRTSSLEKEKLHGAGTGAAAAAADDPPAVPLSESSESWVPSFGGAPAQAQQQQQQVQRLQSTLSWGDWLAPEPGDAPLAAALAHKLSMSNGGATAGKQQEEPARWDAFTD